MDFFIVYFKKRQFSNPQRYQWFAFIQKNTLTASFFFKLAGNLSEKVRVELVLENQSFAAGLLRRAGRWAACEDVDGSGELAIDEFVDGVGQVALSRAPIEIKRTLRFY